MKYGLSDIELNKLREFFARYEDIEEVILYGSRAKGNFHKLTNMELVDHIRRVGISIFVEIVLSLLRERSRKPTR